jgi:IS30 family transposase
MGLDPNRSKQLILVLLVGDIVDEEHRVGGQRRMLTEADREEISRGIAEELEGTVIATRIGRCPSVVSREIFRHGGRAGYRAVAARRVAAERRRRPKLRRLDADPGLQAEVVKRLRAGHSPDQVAG